MKYAYLLISLIQCSVPNSKWGHPLSESHSEMSSKLPKKNRHDETLKQGEVINKKFVDNDFNLSKYKHGLDLYNKNCMQCHGRIEVSDKIGYGVNEIKKAIANDSTMLTLGNLQSLNDRDIEAISFVLNNENPTSIGNLFSLNLISKSMLHQKFLSLYGTTPDSKNKIMQAKIHEHFEELGTPCSRLDKNCEGDRFARANAPIKPNFSLGRFGITMKLCMQILGSETSLPSIVQSFDATVEEYPTIKAIENVHLKMSNGFRISEKKQQSIEKYIQLKKSQGDAPALVWKSLLLGFCMSPLFHTI